MGKTLCSVALDGDPAQFSSRLFAETDLEKFVVSREQLQSNIDGILKALEAEIIPLHCHDAILPLAKKAIEYAKTGSPSQCKLIDELISERLSQLAGDIFHHRERQDSHAQTQT